MNVMFDRSQRSTPVARVPGSNKGPEQLLKVAIVNNMPDTALVATYRQFSGLVTLATGGATELRYYHIPSVPRGEEARRYLEQNAEPVDQLYHTRPDALVVTGNEPKAARLDEEPYWPNITSLVDWASKHTRTTLWSCLAAHAAVLHLDGIERHRLPQKKSGVLACDVSPAGRFGGLPETLTTCHSRLNGIRPADLLANGYEIISQAAGGHVDVFARTYRSRFIFLQGHPEYAADSLMKEYRRDVGRFLRGERDDHPDIPENYFDDETVIRMENFRTKAERTRDPSLAQNFPAVELRSGLEEKLATSAHAIFASSFDALTKAVQAV